jgi:mRNA-degrading endonuclease RelE of RelBE toxin-antitoxin system
LATFMAFTIIYSPEAVEHLAALAKATQVVVVEQIDEQLTQHPKLPTRKRKLLRPNPIAPWELRLGEVRVFYAVEEEPEPLVKIAAVGIKRHNELWVGTEKIEL